MMAAMKIDDKQITLKHLLGNYVEINCLPEIPVNGLSLDSRNIQPGDVFIALEGQTEHGLVYAETAVKKGAVAVLCDRKFDQYCQQILSALMTKVICIPVSDLKNKLGQIASSFYNDASKRLFTVGVTGTDGKTSVSHFIAQALNDGEHPSAVIGTIGNGLINQLETASHTTPDVIQIQKMMADFEAQGVTQVSMEVSSHGLDQGRVDGVAFDVAVLTNLGRDHLDYHGSIEEYQQAKRKLFLNESLNAVVLNLDDEFGQQLAADIKFKCDVWGYSTQPENTVPADKLIKASSIAPDASGLKFSVETPQGNADIAIPLLGSFNVSNVLATLAVMLIKGVSLNDAVTRLSCLNTVPGRVQTIKTNDYPLVVIDYAHTPQALSSVLASISEHTNGKIYCVFGCGGDRDKGKRPLMAKAAEELADVVIVTDDNPRNENPEAIIEDIKSGFSNVVKIHFIHDRKLAIENALSMASENDVVLIAGKGHEDYQIIGDKKLPFSDLSVVQNYLGVNK